jgi:hypothetical protein
MLEIRTHVSNQIMAGIIANGIADHNTRIAELQQRWDWLRDALDGLIIERGAALAGAAPGADTGLLVQHYKNGWPVYSIDCQVLKLVRLLLQHEKHAAEEISRWSETSIIKRQRATYRMEPDLLRLTSEELTEFARLYNKIAPPITECEEPKYESGKEAEPGPRRSRHAVQQLPFLRKTTSGSDGDRDRPRDKTRITSAPPGEGQTAKLESAIEAELLA